MTVTPVVGMGATRTIWSDRVAMTIIAISPNGKTITLQADKATRTDNNGDSESQTYSYEPDPNGEVIKATLRGEKTGHPFWKVVGTPTRSIGNYVSLGARRAYHDYGF